MFEGCGGAQSAALLPQHSTASLCAGCSRAFIRAVEEDDELPVPSPTYLLQTIYDEHAGKTFAALAPNSLHF